MNSSSHDSVDYWKELAEKYKTNWEACQEELDEFQSSSRELEVEMETQLDRQEGKILELQVQNQKQAAEIDSLRVKLNAVNAELRDQVQCLEANLECAINERNEAQAYIRELEQLNDDLERAKRSLVVSLEDFEKRMNETIERNAMLESELDEKDDLAASVQRLKEETRDLKQELQVRERPDKEQSQHYQNGPLALSHDAPVPTEATVRPYQAISTDRPSTAKVARIAPRPTTAIENVCPSPQTANLFTPSARISALNIVGDLLRKVGALESKLASCRKFANDVGNIESSLNKSKIPQLTSPMRPTTKVSSN